MIILREQEAPQTIKFIPREYTAYSVIIRNETTNEVFEFNPSFTIDSYYLKCDLTLDLKENTFYNLTVSNAQAFTVDTTNVKADNTTYTADNTVFEEINSVVYRDRIFCTNQVILDYTVNKDEYVSHATNNDFIIYE